MPLLIGLDEAGFGPNLGPLVIAATVWDVPGDPRRFDAWTAFANAVSQSPDPTGRTVHVADSKSVHSSSAGVAAVERSATAILRLAGHESATLFSLWDGLTGCDGRAGCGEPWFLSEDLGLPIAASLDEIWSQAVDGWSRACAGADCRLVAVACEIVAARKFNEVVERSRSKGRLLSETTLALLRRVWDPAGQPALVLCDKHGGRDRYGDLLADTFPDHLPLGLEESRGMSRYRLGRGEVRFQVRSEEHLPVAAASIVAKYLREAAMTAFNRFWRTRVPDIRPTAGYPVDAKRFRAEAEAELSGLGLAPGDYWRCR